MSEVAVRARLRTYPYGTRTRRPETSCEQQATRRNFAALDYSGFSWEQQATRRDFEANGNSRPVPKGEYLESAEESTLKANQPPVPLSSAQ
jgi:hypothetical protein